MLGLEQVAQAAQAAAEATRSIPWLDVGIIALAVKAVDSIGTAAIRAWQAKSRARETCAKAEMEEAKAFQVAIRGKNGEAKPSLIAFCPAHIDMVKQITGVERDLEHLTKDVAEIKSDVKFIRGAMGK
jgi:hypothetical protein